MVLDAALLPSGKAGQQVRFFARMPDGRMQELERDGDRSMLPKPLPDEDLTDLGNTNLPDPRELAEIQRLKIIAALATEPLPAMATNAGVNSSATPLPISASKSIEGWVDFAKLSRGNYEVGGWSVDLNAPAPLTIGVYLGDRLLMTSQTGLLRVDVGNYFRKKVGLPGFQFRFPANLVPPDQKHAVRFFAISADGSFRELVCDPARCAFWKTP
jgi:hypothetical protein